MRESGTGVARERDATDEEQRRNESAGAESWAVLISSGCGSCEEDEGAISCHRPAHHLRHVTRPPPQRNLMSAGKSRARRDGRLWNLKEQVRSHVDLNNDSI